MYRYLERGDIWGDKLGGHLYSYKNRERGDKAGKRGGTFCEKTPPIDRGKLPYFWAIGAKSGPFLGGELPFILRVCLTIKH